MYVITPYTKAKAKKAGLVVKPSQRKNKKIDVYQGEEYLVSIGDVRYPDYPTYLKEQGAKVANERRRLYHLRHTDDSLASNLAKYLLW